MSVASQRSSHRCYQPLMQSSSGKLIVSSNSQEAHHDLYSPINRNTAPAMSSGLQTEGPTFASDISRRNQDFGNNYQSLSLNRDQYSGNTSSNVQKTSTNNPEVLQKQNKFLESIYNQLLGKSSLSSQEYQNIVDSQLNSILSVNPSPSTVSSAPNQGIRNYITVLSEENNHIDALISKFEGCKQRFDSLGTSAPSSNSLGRTQPLVRPSPTPYSQVPSSSLQTQGFNSARAVPTLPATTLSSAAYYSTTHPTSIALSVDRSAR